MNSDSKPQKNFDVWSKQKVVINIKVTSSNNNKPRFNLGIKCKAQNHMQKINREDKQIHDEMFTQFGPTMTYSKVEIDHFNPLSCHDFIQIISRL